VGNFPLRTPTLPPATHTNCWFLGQRELIIVDPGSPYEDELDRIVHHIESMGKLLRPLRILLTHHHADHIGSVEYLVTHFGAKVLAHERTVPLLPFSVDRVLREGDELVTDLVSGSAQRWAVIYTPGHTMGHIVLYDHVSGSLVAGDMVAGEGTILILPEEGDLGEYLNSLERLKTLGVSKVFPAHGPTLPPSVFADYIDHRNMRSRLIVNALSTQAGLSPLELVPRIYQDLPTSYERVASLQITTHLMWLAENSLAWRSPDGVWFKT
jgi:ribonuclease/clavin/mitogillin